MNCLAVTRAVSPSMANCELTHLSRQVIDIDLANVQHNAYEGALAALGCQVQQLPAEPDLPDSVFVEDAAIVFDAVAVITRPGAVSRRPEIASIMKALNPYRNLYRIQAPGTVDGGDVLCIGKNVYVGISTRSNLQAIEQMQGFLAPYGYMVVGVPVQGCLHLKSAVTLLCEDTLLVNPDWVDVSLFEKKKVIEVDPLEPNGANILWIGDGVIYSANFPCTQARIRKVLDEMEREMVVVDVSELQKAEGAVTCCSLILNLEEHP